MEWNPFGYLLVGKENSVECKTEEEARYLKVFWDAGIKEVKIPRDEKFLKEILVELEDPKRIVDERMNSYMRSILRKQDKVRLRNAVYEDFFEGVHEDTVPYGVVKNKRKKK